MSMGKIVPAREVTEVTPNDTTTFTPPFRAIWVGSSGDVTITDAEGNDATFTVGGAGLIPVEVSRVYATGTDATGIVGLR